MYGMQWKQGKDGNFQLSSNIQKEERSQINNLTLCLKELEKEEKTKPKSSRRKEIIKIRVEINETE